jgi:hypothetical protein
MRKSNDKQAKLLKCIKNNYRTKKQASFRYRKFDEEQEQEPSYPSAKYNEHERFELSYSLDRLTGQMICDKRYIRLGKTKLYDGIEDRYINHAEEYIVVYDTREQKMFCFNTTKLQNDFIVNDKDCILTTFGKFRIKSLTKSIVKNERGCSANEFRSREPRP